MNEDQIGTVANNGQFYTPKYWFAKFKTQQDVLIRTGSKNYNDTKELTHELLNKTPDLLDEVVYVLVELKNV